MINQLNTKKGNYRLFLFMACIIASAFFINCSPISPKHQERSINVPKTQNMAVPRCKVPVKPSLTFNKRAIIFLIDKSKSMGVNEKLENTKQAVKSTINKLEAKDSFGVIGFDQLPFEVVRYGTTNDVKKAQKRVDSLFPSGRTLLQPALELAIKNLSGNDLPRKDIIILTDGLQLIGPDDFWSLAKEAIKEKIVLSAIILSGDYIATEVSDGYKEITQCSGGSQYSDVSSSKVEDVLRELLSLDK